MRAGALIIKKLLEDDAEDDFSFRDVAVREIYTRKDNPYFFNRLERNPPEGAVGHFCRWAAQKYHTIYYRRATYVATKRRKGEGNYWRLIDSGYGSYPYLGSKNINWNDDTIEIP